MEPSTIQEVLEELDRIIEDAIRNNSYQGIFACVYRRVTAQVQQEIVQGNFEDNQRMEIFDVAFANRYIHAFREYQNKQPITQSWKIAFDCRQENLTVIQHLMLGMNAHINLDLSIAASTAMAGSQILDLKNDFEKINEILAALTNEVQSKLGRVSALMFLLDWAGKNTDEKILDFSMKKARGFAWQNAMALSALTDQEKPVRIDQIDHVVHELGKRVKSPRSKFMQFILRIIQNFEEKKVARIIERLMVE